MPLFHYTALDAQGLEQHGAVEADQRRAAASLLRGRGLYVTAIRDEAALPANAGRDVLAQFKEIVPVSTYDRVFFFQQMALMLRSGLTLLQALDTAHQIARSARLATAMQRIAQAVKSGERLSDAMDRERHCFPRLAVQLVRSAEASGELDLIMERIAQDLDRKADLKRNLLTSLMYPAVVVLTAIGVTAFLLVGIIPKMVKFLQIKGNALPPATQSLVDMSAFFQQWGLPLSVLAAGLFAALAFWYAQPRGRLVLDRAMLYLPKVGYSLQIASITQMNWSLAILLKSGVTLLEALRITASVISNKAIAQVIEDAQQSILAGRDVSSSLQHPLLPKLVPQMVAIGERTGTLDGVMQELGDHFQRELTVQIKRLTALIEPTLILLVGGMVGYVYYAFFQAIFAMTG
jgi:type II secretory pathway component PulF